MTDAPEGRGPAEELGDAETQGSRSRRSPSR